MQKSIMLTVMALIIGAGSAKAELTCSDFNTSAFFMTADLAQVETCIEEGADVISPDQDGLTPLFYAVRHAATPLIINALLITAKENDKLEKMLKHRDREGQGIMHVAAADANDPSMLTWLASWGAVLLDRFDCGDGWFDGCTDPLHLAAQRSDSFDYVATLLALGSIVNPKNKKDQTPAGIVRGLGRKHASTLALLMQGDWASSPLSRVRLAAEAEHFSGCDAFLTAEFFHTVSLEEVGACLSAGSYPTATDRDGNTAVHLAAANATDPRIIDLLLYRLHSDDPDLVANALRRTNLNRRSVLQHAAEFSSSPEVVGRLLAWGADVNQLAEPIYKPRVGADRGTSALHLAARRNDPAREAILTVLLAGRASTLLQDQFPEGQGGRQALHYAARNPDVRVIKLLQQAQFHQESRFSNFRETVVRDDRRRTALHVAAGSDTDRDTVWAMVTSRFSPDDTDADGITPLMRAAEASQDPDVFLFLLEHSTQPCRSTASGVTVESFLRQNPALLNYDPTGAELSPLVAYKERCP